MKEIAPWLISLILIVGFLFVPVAVSAQNYKKQDKTFTQLSSIKSSTEDVKTTYTYVDKKNVSYPIYLHKYTKGEKAGKYTAYVIKTSSKTGKEYKYYLKDGEQIAEEIRKEMGLN